jgi:hypothetical protein
MTFKENGISKAPFTVNEIEWRHVWLANPIITSEPVLPREIPRYRTQPHRPSLSHRLHKLHRLRATLSPQT